MVSVRCTHQTGLRVVRAWYDGLEPAPVRGWTPAGPGWLIVKEVIACVVRTRGGSPNGSRRVARRAAASFDRFDWPGPSLSDLVHLHSYDRHWPPGARPS